METPDYNKQAHEDELKTYRFQYFDQDRGDYFPYLPPFDDNNQPQFDYLPDEFVRVKLYNIDSNQTNNNKSSTTNRLIALRNEHFGEILFPSTKKKFPRRPFYTDVLLPKDKYEALVKVLNSYDLQHVKNMLLEVVAISQRLYITKIAYYKKNVTTKEISKAQNEADKLITVLKVLFSDRKSNTSNSGYLKSVTLDTNDIFGKVKIEHQGLLLHIKAALDEYFNDSFGRKWEHWLSKANKYYNQIYNYKRFEKKLAFALHSFLVNEKIVQTYNGQTTPNKLMLFIVTILEHCLIEVGGSEHNESSKIKLVRSWIIEESKIY